MKTQKYRIGKKPLFLWMKDANWSWLDRYCRLTGRSKQYVIEMMLEQKIKRSKRDVSQLE